VCVSVCECVCDAETRQTHEKKNEDDKNPKMSESKKCCENTHLKRHTHTHTHTHTCTFT